MREPWQLQYFTLLLLEMPIIIVHKVGFPNTVTYVHVLRWLYYILNVLVYALPGI